MTYTNNIPQSTDSPSDSQPQILANFQSIATVVNKNHVDFNDGDEGKHKFLQMPEQSSAPTTGANEGGLYTKESNSITELFFRRESDGTEIQLTDGDPSTGTSGYTFLPGGLLLQWGTGSGSTLGTTVNFTTSFSTVYQVVGSVISTSGDRAVSISSVTTSGFTAKTQGNNTISYFAIGLV